MTHKHKDPKWYYTDEELNRLMPKLNALNPQPMGWQAKLANKPHRDDFGERVKTGETFYQRQIGPAPGDVIRLSKLSMARFLYAVFTSNPVLSSLTENMPQAKERRNAKLSISSPHR
jgi:hypothetical protein